MASYGLQHAVWVLICDGRKAIVAENGGDAAAPNLQVRETFEHPDLSTREQGTDRPGRTFASMGERRAAQEPSDFHALAEEDFLKKIAAHLERDVSEQKIRHLILVGPPRALGILRHALSPAVHKVVHHEVERDYVRMPIYEIERHLIQHLSGSDTGH
ncbi:MAG TPA: host attachment family protein [Rhizomicrobium sp.]|nr:host attachment family protein [Rhizomicrobium sp.]